jgi:hypothetical protein
MIMPVAENVESEIIHIRHKDFVVFADKSFRVNRPARVGRRGWILENRSGNGVRWKSGKNVGSELLFIKQECCSEDGLGEG